MDLEKEIIEIKALLTQILVIVKNEPIQLSEEECERISQEKFRAITEFNNSQREKGLIKE